MRNRWGVEIKAGYWAEASYGRNGDEKIAGFIVRTDQRSSFARAYGPQTTIDVGGHEYVVGSDSIRSAHPLPENIKRARRGKNPLSRTSVAADSQRERVSVSAKGRATKTKSPSRRLMARRRATEKAPAGFYANPLTRVKINSPSMATGEAPDVRLIKRRKKTAKGPVGVWANPINHYGDPDQKFWFVVLAQRPRENRFRRVATFAMKGEAIIYARAYHNAHPTYKIKVEDES